jgi:hypothetical protein
MRNSFTACGSTVAVSSPSVARRDPIELAFYELTGIDRPVDVFEVFVETTRTIGVTMKWSDFRESVAPRVLTLGDLLGAAMALRVTERTAKD